jgi:hypothetical protein
MGLKGLLRRKGGLKSLKVDKERKEYRTRNIE